MNADAILAACWVLNPRSVIRAQRLAVAITLLEAGHSRHECRRLLQVRFPECRQPVAWRIVDMAADMAETEKA